MSKLLFEAEVIDGLEPWAAAELKKVGARFSEASQINTAGVLRFRFGKSITRLQKLRVVNQVFRVHQFEVPRPKSLLGQQHFDRIQLILKEAVKSMERHRISSFRLEAAGRDSAVFQRIILEIEKVLKMSHEPEAGDLFLRVKPASGKRATGWELLVRETLRPLATREWRQFNYPGALGGPVAAVMLDIAATRPEDRVLNIMCGSGSLLAEQGEHDGLMVGVDLNETALAGAKQNLREAGARASLFPADAGRLPFADQSFEVLLSDLPWGQLIGEVQDVKALYPLVLQEAWRVAVPGGRFVVITQLKKALHQAIENTDWEIGEQLSLKMGRVAPSIFLLKKASNL